MSSWFDPPPEDDEDARGLKENKSALNPKTAKGARKLEVMEYALTLERPIAMADVKGCNLCHVGHKTCAPACGRGAIRKLWDEGLLSVMDAGYDLDAGGCRVRRPFHYVITQIGYEQLAIWSENYKRVAVAA